MFFGYLLIVLCFSFTTVIATVLTSKALPIKVIDPNEFTIVNLNLCKIHLRIESASPLYQIIESLFQ